MQPEKPSSDGYDSNAEKLKRALKRNSQVLAWLQSRGVLSATIDRLHLGLKQPYRSRIDGSEVANALCFPVLDEGFSPVGRYAYVNVPGVTKNPLHPLSWGPGRVRSYVIPSRGGHGPTLIASDPIDAWLIWQAAEAERVAARILTRTQPTGWPVEWRQMSFWGSCDEAILLPGRSRQAARDEIAADLPVALTEISLKDGSPDWSSYFASGGELQAAIRETNRAPVTVLAKPVSDGDDQDTRLGRFEAKPMSMSGAFANGMMHYPFVVEKREVGGAGPGASLVVQSYETMVVRSDGRILSTHALPAPAGTLQTNRVIALADGTRIAQPPTAANISTWSHGSIEKFVEWRSSSGPAPMRELGVLLDEVIANLASLVWLPGKDPHLVPALYVALSFIFPVFDALPLLLLLGAAGSGKSELGSAIASLANAGMTVGQLRAAGLIRMIADCRGLVVLDDMDGTGSASITGSGELAQMLKTSYKRATACKPLADRGGRARMVDFFGPKVITRTKPVDDVLASRMLTVATSPPPPEWRPNLKAWDEERVTTLRDELHCWAMAHCASVAATYQARRAEVVSRSAEIALPLAILAAAAGPQFSERLEVVLPAS